MSGMQTRLCYGSTEILLWLGCNSLSLAHQRRFSRRAEADVGFAVAEQFVAGEFEAKCGDEGGFVEAGFGGERVVSGPGTANCDRFVRQRPPGHLSLLPLVSPTDDALFDTVDAQGERDWAVLAVADERD
jgi:hypothetical protein